MPAFNRIHPALLSVAAAVFLSLAWYVYPLFACFGFVPLLLLWRHCEMPGTAKPGRVFFFYSYLAFLLWNIAVSWWIVNSTWAGALLAFTINSLLMCLPLLAFRFTARWLDRTMFRLSLPEWWLLPFWLSFEFLHLDWDLSWTWLHLGNSLAFAPYLAQWYSFTGALGGTLWLLAANVVVFRLLLVMEETTAFSALRTYIYLLAAVLLVPIAISLCMYFTYSDSGKEHGIVVVQPNINPYTEKFFGLPNFIPYGEQLQRLVALSEQKITPQTSFVAWPETSLPAGYDEDLLEGQPNLDVLRSLTGRHPNVTLVTGADTYKIYLTEYDRTATARYGEGIGYYDYFNTALKVEHNRRFMLYHKSKLVPGVEQMPYPAFFKFIDKYAINMGGISGSLGKQDERTVFFNKEGIGVAPVVCYESVYGEFVAQYVKNGASYILIITNDAWWGNTPGHVQHFAYARLRAIETRRSVARAANTGISGFINQRGDVLQANTYATQDVLSEQLAAGTSTTFYVQHGDYIGRLARILSLVPLLAAIGWMLNIKIKEKKEAKKAKI